MGNIDLVPTQRWLSPIRGGIASDLVAEDLALTMDPAGFTSDSPGFKLSFLGGTIPAGTAPYAAVPAYRLSTSPGDVLDPSGWEWTMSGDFGAGAVGPWSVEVMVMFIYETMSAISSHLWVTDSDTTPPWSSVSQVEYQPEFSSTPHVVTSGSDPIWVLIAAAPPRHLGSTTENIDAMTFHVTGPGGTALTLPGTTVVDPFDDEDPDPEEPAPPPLAIGDIPATDIHVGDIPATGVAVGDTLIWNREV